MSAAFRFASYQQLSAKSRFSAVGQIGLACIAWPALHTAAPSLWTHIFAGSIILINVLRFAVYRPLSPAAMDIARGWYRRYAAISVATGLGWGMFCAYQIAVHGMTHLSTILMVIIIAGIAAASGHSLTPTAAWERFF